MVRVEHARRRGPGLSPPPLSIDASGTWSARNPLGTSGLPGPRRSSLQSDRISSPLPDVLGRDRARLRRPPCPRGRRRPLRRQHADQPRRPRQGGTRTRGSCGPSAARPPRRPTAAANADGLPARGQLGARLRRLVEAGSIELHTGFGVASLTGHDGGTSPAAVGRSGRDPHRRRRPHDWRPTWWCPAPDSARTWTSSGNCASTSTRPSRHAAGTWPADRPRIPFLRNGPPARRQPAGPP